MTGIAPYTSLATAYCFKSLLQLFLTNVAVFKFIPLYSDTTLVCDHEFHNLDSIVMAITSIIFWLLFPFWLHLLVNTFIPGEAPPALMLQQRLKRPKASGKTCCKRSTACCKGRIKARWYSICGGLLVTSGVICTWRLAFKDWRKTKQAIHYDGFFLVIYCGLVSWIICTMLFYLILQWRRTRLEITDEEHTNGSMKNIAHRNPAYRSKDPNGEEAVAKHHILPMTFGTAVTPSLLP